MEEKDWMLINEDKRPNLIATDETSPKQRMFKNGNEFQMIAIAKGGIGLSLVIRDPAEELLYLYMANVVIDYHTSAKQTVLDGSIQNIQIDNQLPDAQMPIILYMTPTSKTDAAGHLPAVHFTSCKSNSGSTDNAEIYKHLMVTVRNMTLNLEEELIFKALKFAGITRSDLELEKIDESAYEAQRGALIANTTTAKRYYFGTLQLSLNQVKLSVAKSDKQLSPDLRLVKRKLGLTLITFEDAIIDLEPFIRMHPFETVTFLTNAVVHHYQDELLSQAVLILGSTDFLGNPIGFLHDLSEGVSGLVSDGNVGGLLKNVAHGAANSAAKVTGSLSYGISKATTVERYDERRLMIRKRRHGEKSKEHLVAGLKGLGYGMLGGLTSIVLETYDGVSHEGLTGFFTGLGWGLVGTISKPAIGVLDLASGAASAVRESSKSVSKQLPPKLRLPRLVIGPAGSMPVYSAKDAAGQEMLHRMNGRNFAEVYVANEQLRSGHENLQILVSSERVLVFSRLEESKESKLVLAISHGDLVCARALSLPNKDEDSTEDKFYIEFMLNDVDSSQEIDQQKRPQVRCDSEKMSRLVVQQINYARNVFEELTQAVMEQEQVEVDF